MKINVIFTFMSNEVGSPVFVVCAKIEAEALPGDYHLRIRSPEKIQKSFPNYTRQAFYLNANMSGQVCYCGNFRYYIWSKTVSLPVLRSRLAARMKNDFEHSADRAAKELERYTAWAATMAAYLPEHETDHK